MSKSSSKLDKVDETLQSIGTDVALIKHDRELIWNKINEMERDLEELKRILRSQQAQTNNQQPS